MINQVSEQLDLFASDTTANDDSVPFIGKDDLWYTIRVRFNCERERYTQTGRAFPFSSVYQWWWSNMIAIATDPREKGSTRILAIKEINEAINKETNGANDETSPFAIIGDTILPL